MDRERREDSIRLTSPRIIDEIVTKMRKLKGLGYDFYRGPLSNSYETYIEHEANVHSAKIESDEHNRQAEQGRLSFGKLSVPKLVKQLENAYRWGWCTMLGRAADKEKATVNQEFIRALAFRVDPGNFILNKEYGLDSSTGDNLADYRDHSVTVSGSKYTRTSPDKLPLDMQRFTDELNRRLSLRRTADAVETATYAHFHLLRIHPFSDGNGRTARTLQNIILKKNDLPAPLLFSGERFDYYDRIEQALHAWRDRTGVSEVGSPEESAFYNYMAGKISATLDRMVDYSAMQQKRRGKKRNR